MPPRTLPALGEIRNVPSLLSGGQVTTCSHDDDHDNNKGGSVIGTERCVRGRAFTQEASVDYTVDFPQCHIYIINAHQQNRSAMRSPCETEVIFALYETSVCLSRSSSCMLLSLHA